MEGRYARLEPLDPDRHGPSIHAANGLDPTGSMWRWLPYGPFATEAGLAGVGRLHGHLPAIRCSSRSSTGGPGTPWASPATSPIEPAHGSIEVGHLAYSPPLQRTPAATDAMYLLMRNAFDLGYRRYEWKCDSLNGPSRAAAQRLGLSYEGVFRQHRVVKEHNRDSAWYAAVDGEWPRLRTAFERWLEPANFDADGRQRERLSDLTGPVLVARG